MDMLIILTILSCRDSLAWIISRSRHRQTDIDMDIVYEHHFASLLSGDAGDFALVYRGEATSVLPYNSSASEIRVALGNLDTLVGADISTETVNCSMPEVSCSWRVTFRGVHGDAEPLVPIPESFDGNRAEITVEELVKGQKALDVSGSPATVGNSYLEPLLAIYLQNQSFKTVNETDSCRFYSRSEPV